MTNEPKTPKAPTHIIWQVIDAPAKSGDTQNAREARWIRVGAAWQNRDGKGLSLRFDAYPVVGRIVIREAEREASE